MVSRLASKKVYCLLCFEGLWLQLSRWGSVIWRVDIVASHHRILGGESPPAESARASCIFSVNLDRFWIAWFLLEHCFKSGCLDNGKGHGGGKSRSTFICRILSLMRNSFLAEGNSPSIAESVAGYFRKHPSLLSPLSAIPSISCRPFHLLQKASPSIQEKCRSLSCSLPRTI